MPELVASGESISTKDNKALTASEIQTHKLVMDFVINSHGFEHIDPQSRVLNYCFQ